MTNIEYNHRMNEIRSLEQKAIDLADKTAIAQMEALWEEYLRTDSYIGEG